MSQPDETTPHILIVDDDTRIRDLLQKYLSDNGYRTSTAGDAREAQSRMDALEYDLLVLDIMMPGLTGLEFTQKLRAAETVPILLLTALAETEQRIEGLSIGADDYLPKPFDPKELLLECKAFCGAAYLMKQPLLRGAFGACVPLSEESCPAMARITLTTREIESSLFDPSAGRVESRSELADGECFRARRTAD